MTWSAPIERTSSTFRVLTTAVTSAPSGLGDLDREGADAARGAVDQDLLAGPHLAVVAHGLEGDETGHRHGRRLLEREARGLGRKLVLGRGRVLGIRAPGRSVDLVTDAEAGDRGADGLDDARDVRAPGGDLRLAQAVDRAGDVREAAHDRPVGRVDARRADPEQHLVVADLRLVDLRDAA